MIGNVFQWYRNCSATCNIIFNLIFDYWDHCLLQKQYLCMVQQNPCLVFLDLIFWLMQAWIPTVPFQFSQC
jgi:hypothetical protein